MMTPSNEKLSALLALCEKIHRWIPITKASDAEFDGFFDLQPEQMFEQTLEGPVISDTIAPIMTPL